MKNERKIIWIGRKYLSLGQFEVVNGVSITVGSSVRMPMEQSSSGLWLKNSS